MSESLNFKAELVGAFGQPIAENPTGVMQEAAFAALGLNWRYLLIEVARGDLEDAIKGFRAFNMRGVNLTIPHKVDVIQYLDGVAPDVEVIGAVNTVRRDGDRLIGENTDAKGFLQSLQDDAGVDPSGKRFVVLGAGGAARAITVQLALAGAGSITVVNRSVDRGETLVGLLQERTAVEADFVHWSGPYAVPAGIDVVVNATSIGLYPNVDDVPELDYDSIRAGMTVCDVIPNPPDTKFLAEASKRGAQTLDGMGMLVNQGAVAFKLWTGLDAPTDVMLRAVAEAFGRRP